MGALMSQIDLHMLYKAGETLWHTEFTSAMIWKVKWLLTLELELIGIL